jgi:transketolase
MRPIMQFQFDVASSSKTPPLNVQPPTAETVPELLRQILEVQRDQLTQILEVQKEHLNHARATAQDNLSRWRQLLTRWQDEYPEFAEHCKKAYPLMEKSFMQMLSNMVEELAQQGDESLDSEFAVQEFLDRYGMKLGQLSHLMSIVGPLSEAANQIEASKQP